jgi:ribosome maturation factor RimP
MGQEVEVRTYKPIDKCKEFTGILTGYENGDVTIQMEDTVKTFTKADVALVRLTFDF